MAEEIDSRYFSIGMVLLRMTLNGVLVLGYTTNFLMPTSPTQFKIKDNNLEEHYLPLFDHFPDLPLHSHIDQLLVNHQQHYQHLSLTNRGFLLQQFTDFEIKYLFFDL
jgi:hypothetical protein